MKKNFNQLPFSPSKFPFFYGWIVLLVGILGVLMSIPGQTMGVSVFTDSLISVLNISRVNLSLAYMVGTIVNAFLLTSMGKKLDRYGARIMGTIVIILLGLTLLSLSFLDVMAENCIKVSPFSHQITLFILMSCSFFLIRFFGQGMLTLLSRNMVMKWFDHHRGMANAILGMLTSFGFSIAPQGLNVLVEEYNWNGAWRVMGLFLLTIGALLFFLFGRDNPESCGLLPDGKILIKDKNRPPSTGKDRTLQEARKTLPFWICSLTLGMHALYATAVTFHIVSIFESVHLPKTMALGLFFPASIIAVIFNFGGNWLSDYIPFKFILITQLIGQLISMFFVAHLGSSFSYIMLIIGYGIMGGLFNVTNTIIWPRFYGRAHLGAITGMVMSFTVAGSAIGPYLFSQIKILTGSYQRASLICFILSLTLIIFAFFVKNPNTTEG